MEAAALHQDEVALDQEQKEVVADRTEDDYSVAQADFAIAAEGRPLRVHVAAVVAVVDAAFDKLHPAYVAPPPLSVLRHDAAAHLPLVAFAIVVVAAATALVVDAAVPPNDGVALLPVIQQHDVGAPRLRAICVLPRVVVDLPPLSYAFQLLVDV